MLAGLVHCPICGKRLNVVSESDRWTNGKPRFKYVCPGYRKKTCHFKAVDGVLLDEFIVQQLSNLSDEDSEHFKEILEIKVEELRETERLLFKLDENRENNMVAIHDLEQTKERLLSFAEYAKDAQPEVMVALIRSIVERIYIVDRDDERYCHIFIKGCTGEDCTGFFQIAGYIEQNTAPVCDSEQDCICIKV